ncbi:MAG: hypothetical protein JOZ99_00880 [Actinobacteria bacterium]|nr:hypothetical protein [Actinomycetota bacterium]
MTALTGRVVVIAIGDETARDAALACAADGAAVVLVADREQQQVAAETARDVVDAGGRASVFAGSLVSARDRDALGEMLAELF